MGGAFDVQNPSVKRRSGRRRAAIAPAICLSLALAGCTTQPAAGGDRPVAALGGTAVVGPLRVTPVAVIEDSRCPQAINCVWAGRVRIAARANGAPIELTLGQPVPVAGGALLLAEVQPPRQPELEIAPADYRFRFTFT